MAALYNFVPVIGIVLMDNESRRWQDGTHPTGTLTLSLWQAIDKNRQLQSIAQT